MIPSNSMDQSEDICQADIIYQDGIACPKTPPWPQFVSYISLAGMPFTLCLAFYIYLKTGGYFKLVVWLSAMFFFAVPLRYLVCARCPYYGQNCSTISGKTVSYIFKKQEGKSMVPGLYLDIIFFMFLFLFPLPAAYKAGGMFLLIVWVGLNGISMLLLTRLGCNACPFTYCPIGKLSRAFWGKFGKKD